MLTTTQVEVVSNIFETYGTDRFEDEPTEVTASGFLVELLDVVEMNAKYLIDLDTLHTTQLNTLFLLLLDVWR